MSVLGPQAERTLVMETAARPTRTQVDSTFAREPLKAELGSRVEKEVAHLRNVNQRLNKELKRL